MYVTHYGSMSDFHNQFTLRVRQPDGSFEDATLIVGGYEVEASHIPTTKELNEGGPIEFAGVLQYVPSLRACAGQPLQHEFAGVVRFLKTGEALTELKEIVAANGWPSHSLDIGSPDPARTDTATSSELGLGRS